MPDNACILNDKDYFVDLTDAAKTHEICFALDRSATEGRPIKIAEI